MTSVFNGKSPKTRDTHTYCRAFGSVAVTTCCNDLGLSRDNIVMDVVIVLHALNWAVMVGRIKIFVT